MFQVRLTPSQPGPSRRWLVLIASLVMGAGCAAQSDASVESDEGSALGNSTGGYKTALHNMEWFFRTRLLPLALGPDGRPTPLMRDRAMQRLSKDKTI
ncbi:MAG: hypothetical protein H6715_04800 [Myxococcales bacterium]|nr:hypothetical protein [Myxococcales bacterium]MCB9708480.1 hypothetical protein [Myxococcales bacterium]